MSYIFANIHNVIGSTCNTEWNWTIEDREKINQNESVQQSSDVFKIKKMHNCTGQGQIIVVKFQAEW